MIRPLARLLVLLLPAAVILVAAAATPVTEFLINQGDAWLYFDKARAVATGLLPYRDFPLEYPPLALVPMAVPYFAWPFGDVTRDAYTWLFAGWEVVLILALGFVLRRIVRLDGDDRARRDPLGGRLGRAAIQLIPLTIGAALALTWRFDLFPALLVMVALWAALGGRPGTAGIVIGLGILAKLYPIAVVPALAIPWLCPLDVRRFARYCVGLLLTVTLVMLPFWLVAGSNAFGFLTYQAQRGLQIESIGGGLAVLGGLLVGQPVGINHQFGSVQVDGAFTNAWLTILPVLTLAAFGLLGVIGWRRVQRDLAADGAVSPATVVALAGAAVLVLIATNKVFSIQYIVWIVPFAALLRGGRFWLALAVVALTMPIHPVLYEGLVAQRPLSILVLNLRNALFLALLAWTLWDVARPAIRSEPR